MKEDIFKESGHALVWCEFDEKGCPLTKKQAEKEYFLTKKDILKIAKEIQNKPINNELEQRRTTITR